MGGSPVWLPARKWSKNGRCAPGARRRRPTVHLLPLHDLLPLRDEKRFIAVHVHSAPKCSGRSASSKHLRCVTQCGAVAGHSGNRRSRSWRRCFPRPCCVPPPHACKCSSSSDDVVGCAAKNDCPCLLLPDFGLSLVASKPGGGDPHVQQGCRQWVDGGGRVRRIGWGEALPVVSHITPGFSPPPSLPALLSLFLRIGKCWFQVGRW